jgi:plasmid stability protein
VKDLKRRRNQKDRPMAHIVVDDLEPRLLERLERLATLHRRSVSTEVRAILEEATKVGLSPLSISEFIERTQPIRTYTAGRPQTDSAILVREDRER